MARCIGMYLLHLLPLCRIQTTQTWQQNPLSSQRRYSQWKDTQHCNVVHVWELKFCAVTASSTVGHGPEGMSTVGVADHSQGSKALRTARKRSWSESMCIGHWSYVLREWSFFFVCFFFCTVSCWNWDSTKMQIKSRSSECQMIKVSVHYFWKTQLWILAGSYMYSILLPWFLAAGRTCMTVSAWYLSPS